MQNNVGIKLFFISLLFATSQVKANDQNTRPYELKYANKKLNETYKKIIGKLEPSKQIRLKKAQRQWIIFRDLDCAWAYSAEPLDCLIERTDSRTKELQDTLFVDLKGDYLSVND